MIGFSGKSNIPYTGFKRALPEEHAKYKIEHDKDMKTWKLYIFWWKFGLIILIATETKKEIGEQYWRILF